MENGISAINDKAQLFYTLNKASSSAICFKDSDNRILEANDTLCKYTEYTAHELSQMSFLDLFVHHEKPQLLQRAFTTRFA